MKCGSGPRGVREWWACKLVRASFFSGAASLECRPAWSNLPNCLQNVESSDLWLIQMVVLVNSNLKHCMCVERHIQGPVWPFGDLLVVLALRATTSASAASLVLCVYLATCGSLWWGFAQGVLGSIQEHGVYVFQGVHSLCTEKRPYLGQP